MAIWFYSCSIGYADNNALEHTYIKEFKIRVRMVLKKTLMKAIYCANKMFKILKITIEQLHNKLSTINTMKTQFKSQFNLTEKQLEL